MMFGFFKKKSSPKVASIPVSDRPSLPTVKAAPEMFDCYAEVFRVEMATITPFTKKQVEDMLAFIQDGEGGFLNLAHYHKPIFDRYFKDADWSWPEFEKWQAIFKTHGSTPISWPHWGDNPYGIGLYELLMRLINFRAKSVHEKLRREKMGVGSKLMILHEQDRPFVEMALQMNPDALPPFFPTDVTTTRADMDAILGKN